MASTIPLLLFSLLPTADAPPTYPRPELLLEAAELAGPEGARFRVLDARPREKYLAGHAPRAVHLSPFAWAKAFEAEQDSDEWTRRIGELGLQPADPVAVYDDGSAKDAARVWWILRYWGFRDVRLVNGGWAAHEAAKLPSTTDVPVVKAVEPKLMARIGRLATMDELKDILAEKRRPQIVDARSEKEYCGLADTAKRNGAIPGAIHLEWSELLDPKTQRFKPAADLTRLLKERGLDPLRPAVTYCQSGGRASVMAFALELMGGRDVRNYYRSWAEWGNATDAPVEKGKPRN